MNSNILKPGSMKPGSPIGQTAGHEVACTSRFGRQDHHPEQLRQSRREPRRAFSRTDLLAVLAVVAALAMLHTVAASALTKERGALATCLNNLRQLTSAWVFYAEANNGKLVANSDGALAATGLAAVSKGWCGGWLDLNGGWSDNTNVLLLRNALLGQYVSGSFGIYRCPADHSVVTIGGVAYPRVRSVSMQSYMGYNYNRGSASQPYTSGYRQFLKITDITAPAPAKAFVFLDERDDSINDGWLAIDMTGFDPRNTNALVLGDVPADYHEGGANLSFADGHVETWHWRDPRTTPPHRRGRSIPLEARSPGNLDVERIQAAASRKIDHSTR